MPDGCEILRERVQECSATIATQAAQIELLTKRLDEFSKYVALNCFDIHLVNGMQKSERLDEHLDLVGRALDDSAALSNTGKK